LETLALLDAVIVTRREQHHVLEYSSAGCVLLAGGGSIRRSSIHCVARDRIRVELDHDHQVGRDGVDELKARM
jgi:hypothetical protein